jgi:predicted Zn-dependent protease
VVEQLAPPEARCDDPALTHRLDEILAALTAPLPRSPYTFRVVVADDPAFNALAAPGGHIVVFRGLLQKTRTPEELAGVLAHEAQHVLRRHTTRALIQHASVGLLLAALTGDASGAMAFGLESARTIGFLQYSRRHETEADEEGLRMVAAAGIDPAGMIAFFETLSEEAADLPGMLKYLSTHPSTAERIERLHALAANADRGPATPLPHDDWPALRDACSSRPDSADRPDPPDDSP